MRTSIGLAILALLAAASIAAAQTIQLPSFSSFSVNTTVVVPDGGTAVIGGTGRAYSGANRFNGISRQQAIGVQRQTSTLSVTANVHDPQAADEALLRKARARRAGQAAGAGQPAPAVDLALSSDDAGLKSVAELRRERAAALAAGDRETLELVAKARRAQRDGKDSLARLYLRTAAREAKGPLKQQIDRELARLVAELAARRGADKKASARRPSVPAEAERAEAPRSRGRCRPRFHGRAKG